MKSDFMMALNQLSAERGLRKDLVLDKVELALATAFRRDSVAGARNLSVKLNPNTGDISIFPLRTVVDEIDDPETQIILAEAQEIAPDVELGSEIPESDEVHYDTSRISAQTARQVLIQGLREAEREKVFDEYSAFQGEIINGSVDSVERNNRAVHINLNPHQAQNQRTRGVMRHEHQVTGERYRKGQNIKVLLVEVQQTARGPEVIVSRSHRDLLRRLIEAEVPEISNGTVEIRAVSRDPGVRSKIAVASRQDGVDPVGSCIGLRGNRIQSIVNELQGEKIDVIEWDSNPSTLIARALSPADVTAVEIDQAERTAYVVVPENQMSLAIGRDGQNARLAARLTGWRLDIKNVEQWEVLREARAAEAEVEAARLAAVQAQAAQEARAAGAADTELVAAVAETDAALPDAAPAEAAPAGDEALVATAVDAESPSDALDPEPFAAPTTPEAEAEIGIAPDAGIAAAIPTPAPEATPPADTAPTTPAAPAPATSEPAALDPDEDALLEALIAAEEAPAASDAETLEPEPLPAVAETEPETAGLSVAALENLTIDDVIADAVEDDEDSEEDYEYEEEDDDYNDIVVDLSGLAPDAGKIRFAEDIVGDFRGGAGRRRRGGGNNNRRGGNVPGARGGPGARRR